MTPDDFTTTIEFEDGAKVELGDDNFYVSPADGHGSVELNDERLRLIRLLHVAELEATEVAPTHGG